MRFPAEMFTSYPSSVTAPNVKLPSIGTVDLRAGVSLRQYLVQFRVDNVLNEFGVINYAPGTPGSRRRPTSTVRAASPCR